MKLRRGAPRRVKNRVSALPPCPKPCHFAPHLLFKSQHLTGFRARCLSGHIDFDNVANLRLQEMPENTTKSGHSCYDMLSR